MAEDTAARGKAVWKWFFSEAAEVSSGGRKAWGTLENSRETVPAVFKRVREGGYCVFGR